MRTNRTERTEPRAMSVALGLGIVTGAVAIGLIAHVAQPITHHCFEDEAQVVIGQALACVPVDDIIHPAVLDKLSEHAEQHTYYVDWEYAR